MDYFCATCQKKHDIGDIAADLYEICSEEIADNLKELQSSLSATELEEFYKLVYFCRNDSEHAGISFTLKGSEVEQYLLNVSQSEKNVRGNLILDLEWLLDAYERSGARGENSESDNSENADLKTLFEEQLHRPLFNREVVFSFGEVGKNRERVLDHYTDSNNDPSFNNRELLGYRRVCPHCGKRLPRAVGRAPEIVIALSGSPRAGKTSCLTAVASALSSGRYSQYGLSMDTFNYDDQWEALSKEVASYEKGYAVLKTEMDQSSAPSYSLLIRVGNTKRVLTFVDMPGEFFQSGKGLTKEFFKQYSGLFLSIDCIWFFVSKLKVYDYDLGEVNKQTEKQIKLVEATSERPEIFKEDSVANFNANLMSLREQITSNGRKMPPALMVITKTEVDVSDEENQQKYNLFPVNTDISSKNVSEIKKVLSDDNRGNYRLEENAFYASSSKVRQFFYKTSAGLANAFEKNCPYRFYAASASYGHYAASVREEDTREPLPPTPYHEMYPVFWTLAICSALPVNHYCSWAEKKLLGGFKDPVEGSQTVFFNVQNYIYGAEKSAADEAEEDRILLEKDVGANLLTETDPQNRATYKQTDFKHKRRA